ncbi:monovalent cation/H+ antiporter subunit D [Alkanindiges sp. WGS2144]|uniref:monovalent cation/H+ antiporter subunit D n=1 Tax=Alkanindiges sp. WGS2144 TaxID=3366808 RepID=UPI003752AD7B
MWHSLLQFWHFHTPVFSILVPAFTAFSLILVGYPSLDSNKHKRRLHTSRLLGLAATFIGLLLSLDLFLQASNGTIKSYYLGEWAAPFGIVLVLDRLSALMLLLTYILALPVLWYAIGGWDQKGRFFHAMFQFQLMGLCGAFLTGDLFNLFVFFEILLIASYVLLLHGQGRVRFRMGVHYVVINLLASALFLIGLAIMYGNVGSLNMVDVARLLPELPPDQFAMAQTAGMILLVVFGVKAAILPLSFWLPSTYAAAVPPVAALFAIMTKVGVYSILRVNGTIFATASTQTTIQFTSWLLPIALLSSLFGAIGALAAHNLRRLAGYMLLSSVGTLLIGIALFNTQAWSAALYYLVHSTLIIAAFYMLAEWISNQRNATEDTLQPTFAVQQPVLLSILALLVMMMIVGLPPFSGFLGKVMLLQSATGLVGSEWIIITILLVSFISLVALTRAGIVLFWQTEPPNAVVQAQYSNAERIMPYHLPTAFFCVLGCLVLLVIFASPVKQYMNATAAQLKEQSTYQHAVLQYDDNHQAISERLFDPAYLPYSKNMQGNAITDNTDAANHHIQEDEQLLEHAEQVENPSHSAVQAPQLPREVTSSLEPAREKK